jgi:hypothetical protein
MRTRRRPLAWGSATAIVLVFAAALFVTRGLVDVIVMVVTVAALAGLYLMRRYARATLVYNVIPARVEHRSQRRGAEHLADLRRHNVSH